MTKFIDEEANLAARRDVDVPAENSRSNSNETGLQTFLMCRQFSTEISASLDALFAKYSLSFGRFNILMVLAKSPLGLMPSELASFCQVTQATISGLLNSLEKSQIIQRQEHHQDGRAFVIKLSEKGYEILNKIQPEFCKKVEEIFLSLDPDEVVQLQGLLTKLRIKIQNEAELN